MTTAALLRRRRGPSASTRPAAAPHVWDEAGFRERIRLECARSDRSGRAFSLLVLREPDPQSANAITRRIAGRIRETDELGRMDAVQLGVLLTETPREGAGLLAGEVAALLRQDNLLLPAPAVYTYPGDWIGATAEPDEDPYGAPPPVPAYPRWKRTMDVAGALVALAILAPLLAVAALAVRLSSPGPVLFRQARIGYGGRPFAILKFRTMTHGAGDDLHARYVAELVAGRAAPNGSGEFKLRGDPRVTRVGAVLRRWSLDELPQLLNVLRGEMALVGPRPEPCYARQGYAGWYHRRVLETKPGITGPWQVAARSRVTYENMVRMDLRYGRTLTAHGDVGLLVRTLRAVVRGEGAC
jgi:lipopolysaccharide/colanic/teichoic acid biosynthesis glycosyltransferase